MVLVAQQFDSLEEDSHRLPDPLRIVFTSNLPDVLRPLDISLIVSTCEAGKVFPNLEDGGSTNTHFRKFQKPTGIYAGGRPPGAGADTIVLSGGTYIYASDFGNGCALPTISSEITIEGNGSTISRSGAAVEFGMFHIDPDGDLTLNEATISSG